MRLVRSVLLFSFWESRVQHVVAVGVVLVITVQRAAQNWKVKCYTVVNSPYLCCINIEKFFDILVIALGFVRNINHIFF